MPEGSSAERRDDFYVGYLPVPRGHARLLRVLIPGMLWVMVVVAGLIAWQMRDPGSAVWDTADERTWQGRLVAQPYPGLLVEGEDGVQLHLLVEMAKHGAQDRVVGLEGRTVEVRGWLLQRDDRRIIELSPDESAITAVGGPAPGSGPVLNAASVREVTLRGEIMDSKCYLGAMKPGDGKAHKACATLCIAGGIPPMLVTHDASGNASYYLLTDELGGPAGADIHPFIGEPVEVTGQLSESMGVQLLAVGSVSRP